MPLVRCTVKSGPHKGKKGWKYGKDNTSCFFNKIDAVKQGVAIHIQRAKGDKKKGYKSFRKEMSKADEEVLKDILSDLTTSDNEVAWASEVLDLSMNQKLTLSVNRRIAKNG